MNTKVVMIRKGVYLSEVTFNLQDERPPATILHIYTTAGPGFSPGTYYWSKPLNPFVGASSLGGTLLNGSMAMEIDSTSITSRMLDPMVHCGEQPSMKVVDDIWTIGLVASEVDEVSRLSCLYDETYLVVRPAERQDDYLVVLTGDLIPILVSTASYLESKVQQLQQKHVSKSHSNQRRRG